MVFTKTDAVYLQPIASRQIGIHQVRVSDWRLKRLLSETSLITAIAYAEFSSDCLVFIELLHSD